MIRAVYFGPVGRPGSSVDPGPTVSGRTAVLSTGCQYSVDPTETAASREGIIHKNSVKYYLDHKPGQRRNCRILDEAGTEPERFQ